MKKYLSFALALALVVSVLAGCGGSNNSDGSDSSSDSAEVLTADSLKTIGDVEALENKTEDRIGSYRSCFALMQKRVQEKTNRTLVLFLHSCYSSATS